MNIRDFKGNIYKTLPQASTNLLQDKKLISDVERIIEDVTTKKDKAVIEYSKNFDKIPDNFNIKASDEEIQKAKEEIENNKELKSIYEGFKVMAERVKKFHEEQLKQFNLQGKWLIKTNGSVGQVIKPIESVCVYVPGGRAIYPSTLIMNVIPAKVAGVKNIYVSTPSKEGKVSPIILALSSEFGVNGVYKVGGALAVASFAFGTESIPKVNMIVGPGNKYFITAKKILSGIIGIDIIPGPSEIAIIADNGNPYYLALDTLSQLEHDPDSLGFVISNNKKLLDEIEANIHNILKRASRKDILQSSTSNLFFIEVEDINEGFNLVNEIGPEHLEVIVEGVDIENIENFVYNAGTVLVGEYSSVTITDYLAGTNHVLPTSSTSKFYSPLGVYNFLKFYNIAKWTKEELEKDKNIISKLARYEGLEIHALAVEERLK
ncbi:MAG: histidinol dehydrogenase [Brevinematia bacterium]